MPAPLSRESREQFERRMLDMVSLVETTDTVFFHKRVSRSMATECMQGPFAYSLEFPRSFLRRHSKKLGKDATFTTLDSHRTWPIEISVRCCKESKSRVFAYGLGGWKAFLTDNNIKVGDILVFHLIGFSRFQVLIGRAPEEVHGVGNNNAKQDGNNNTSQANLRA